MRYGKEQNPLDHDDARGLDVARHRGARVRRKVVLRTVDGDPAAEPAEIASEELVLERRGLVVRGLVVVEPLPLALRDGRAIAVVPVVLEDCDRARERARDALG
jgi:hypothetical protein